MTRRPVGPVLRVRPDADPPEAQAKIHRRAHPRGRRRVESYSATAADLLGEIHHDEDVFGLTGGQFSLLDLVRAALLQTGPAHLVLSTWTIGVRDVDGLAWMIESDQVISAAMAVDGGMERFAAERASYLVWRFGEDAIHVGITHAKFVTIRNDSWDLALLTSMNLSGNPRTEHFQLLEDAGLCDMLDDHVRSMPVGIHYRDAVEHLRSLRSDAGPMSPVETQRHRMARKTRELQAKRSLKRAREQAREGVEPGREKTHGTKQKC